MFQFDYHSERILPEKDGWKNRWHLYSPKSILVNTLPSFSYKIQKQIPLKYIFESSFTADICPEDWKNGNIIPVHKKSKNCLKNHRSISVFPIFSKIFERLIFNALFNLLFKISCLQITNEVLFQAILVFRNYYL